jgi:hypothetical protein
MNSHLNENQINDALLGLAEAGEREHLEQCEQCRAQLAAERGMLHRFGQQVRREARRDEQFWARQQLVISSRLEHNARRRTLHAVWGVAAAAAAALVVWVALGQIPSKPALPPSHEQARQHENDDLLLRQVALALERGSPEAFAPAEVLTRELNRSTTRKGPKIREATNKPEAKTQ